MGLFGSVYLMPVFLAYVRGHSALEIGEIMLVTGVAQLGVAPVAVAMVQRLDERLLSALAGDPQYGSRGGDQYGYGPGYSYARQAPSRYHRPY
jgi:hypothetical protein